MTQIKFEFLSFNVFCLSSYFPVHLKSLLLLNNATICGVLSDTVHFCTSISLLEARVEIWLSARSSTGKALQTASHPSVNTYQSRVASNLVFQFCLILQSKLSPRPNISLLFGSGQMSTGTYVENIIIVQSSRAKKFILLPVPILGQLQSLYN